jgi:drug/metabolite transporter (DMT)-like permease
MMRPVRSATRGFVLVLVASTCFGTLGVFSSLFYDDGGNPWTLLFLRFVVTGPVLAIVAVLLGDAWPGRRLALIGASLGVFQFGVGFGLLEGFERAPVALVSLLYFAYPLMVAVGATLIYREAVSARRGGILAVALTGVALIVGIPDSANWAGILLGLVAAFCVTGSVLSSQRLMTTDGVSPIVLSALMFTSPAILLLLLIPMRSPDFDVSVGAWGWALGAVFIAAVFPIACFYTGVKSVGASVAGLLSTAEPLVTVTLAYIVLGESLTAVQLVGGGLIVISVAALSLEGRHAPVVSWRER